MTGPEHYRRAEECLAALEEGEDNTEWLMAAQVHATLALAAAEALDPNCLSVNNPTTRAWLKAVGAS